MNVNEFSFLKFFTQREVEATGANIKDVKFVTMRSLDYIRFCIARRIMLLPNGLTTGNHASPLHPEGYAVDFFLHPDDGEVTNAVIYQLVRAAIDAGFMGIGIYRNHVGVYSFHLDLRKEFTVWVGRRSVQGQPWNMTPMTWGEPFSQ